MKQALINCLVLKNAWRMGAIVLTCVVLGWFGLTSGVAQLKNQKRIVSMRVGEATEGSRVTVVSDLALNDYEAYRRGNRFYVKIPAADSASSRPNLNGHGFEDVQVQKVADSVIISFQLQPGTTARVDQRFNRLDVVFSTPAKSQNATSSRSRLATVASGGIGRAQNAGNLPGSPDTAGPLPPKTSQGAPYVIQNRPPAPISRSEQPRSAPKKVSDSAANIATAGQSPVSPTVVQTAQNNPPASTAFPNNSSATPASVSGSPASAANSPGSLPSPSFQNQTTAATAQPAATPLGTIDSRNVAAGKSLGGQYLSLYWYVGIIAALLLLGLGFLIVTKRVSKLQGAIKRWQPAGPGVKPKSQAAAALREPVVAAAASSKETSFVDHSIPVASRPEATQVAIEPPPVVPILSETGRLRERPSIPTTVQNVSHLAVANPLLAAEPLSKAHVYVGRPEDEVKKLLARQDHDVGVIDAADSPTRQVISDTLLAALSSQSFEQHEPARRAYLDHGYFDDATRDLRTADSPAERAAAARKLGLVRATQGTVHLIAALNDRAPEVRRAAVESLGQIGDSSASPALDVLLLRETSRQLPQAVIHHALNSIRAVGVEAEAVAERSELNVSGVVESHTYTEVQEPETSRSFIESPYLQVASAQIEVPRFPLVAVPPPVAPQQVEHSLVADEARLRLEEQALRRAAEDVERRRLEAQAARQKAEDDARYKAEQEARLRAEAEVRLRMEDEARRKAEQEAARQAQEEAYLREELARRARAEDEVRLRAEEEARFRLEAEALKRAAEDLARKRFEAEAARKLAEEEARRRADEVRRIAEESRLRAEAEARARAEEEARLRAEVEARVRAEEARLRAEAEARARAEEEARRKLEEEARLRAEAEVRRLAEEEAQRLAEEDRLRREAEERRLFDQEQLRQEQEALLIAAAELTRRRAELEDTRRRAEEEARLLLEAQDRIRVEEEERRRFEDERQRLELAAQRRLEEERQQREAEALRRAEEDQRKVQEQARLLAEAEDRRLADLDAVRKMVSEQAQRRAQQEQRIKAEIEALRQAEQEQHQRIEAETRRRAEAEARLKEEEARRLAQEEARLKAEAESRRLAAEARRLVEEEAQRRAAAEDRLREEEARRLAQEEARLKAEDESRRLAEEARVRVEEEAQRRAEAEARLRAEEALRQAEADARLKAEEETRRVTEEARVRAEKEAQRLAEAEARLKEEEVRRLVQEEARLKAEDETRRLAEESRLRAEEEAQRRAEAEARFLEQESRRQADEAARRQAEEEIRLRAEEEAQRRAEAEARLKEEEARREEDERARLKAEEETRRLREEAQLRTEEEARRRAEAEARLLEEEARRRAEEEARFGAEEDGRRLTEEAHLRAEEEAARRAEAEARLVESEARRQIEEEARLRAEEKLLQLAEDARFREEENASRLAIEEAQQELVREHVPIEATVTSFESSDAPWVQVNADIETSVDTLLFIEEESAEGIDVLQVEKGLDIGSEQKSIEQLGDDSNIPADLLKKLRSDDAGERTVALVELSHLGDDQAFTLISGAFDDQTVEVRNAAARALYEAQPDRAASFTRALREGSPERRRNIGAALAASGLANDAITNLTGESREKTYDAFSLLFLMAKAGEIQPLMQAIEEHDNIEARLAVVKLLALSGQQEVVPAFRRLAVRGSLPSEVRSAVMEAIYQISSQSRETETAPSAV